MNRQTSLCSLAIASLMLISCAQAGLVKTNQNMDNAAYNDDQMSPPPPAYEDIQLNGHEQENFMNQQQQQQYYADQDAAYAHLEQEYDQQQQQHFEQQQEMENQVDGKQQQQRGGFGAHLRDLGKVGMEGTKRVYQDAKPALENIRGDFGQAIDRVKQNPRVAKVIESTKPHVMNAYNKGKPLVEKSSKMFGDFASKANQKIHDRLAQRKQQKLEQQAAASASASSNGVFPVRPAGASMEE